MLKIYISFILIILVSVGMYIDYLMRQIPDKICHKGNLIVRVEDKVGVYTKTSFQCEISDDDGVIVIWN